jgi:hypothetical protein
VKIVSARAPVKAPTVDPKQKPETNIITVMNSNAPGRYGILNTFEYDIATTVDDSNEIKANFRADNIGRNSILQL